MQLSILPDVVPELPDRDRRFTEGVTGDPLDRYYTPDDLADAVVRMVVDRYAPDTTRVVEPSVGGGVFVRALREVAPGAQLVGVDVDPGAAGLALCDEHHLGPLSGADIGGCTWAAGNPPFGGPRDEPSYLGARHARMLVQSVPIVSLILPLHWIGARGVDDILLRDCPARVHRIYPRPWANLREVGLWVWSRAHPPADGCSALIERDLLIWR